MLGAAWTFGGPLSLVLAYSAVFHYAFRVVAIPAYPLFLVSGMAAWLLFAAGLQAACESLVANAPLVRKVRFSRQLLPLSAVCAHAITALALLAIVVPLNLLFVPSSRSPALIVLPFALALLAALTFGMGLALAALNVYLRDVQHILATLLVPWFFLTPVLYTHEALPPGAENFRWLAVVLEWGNVVAPFVIVVRDAAYAGAWPSVALATYCVVAASVALLSGTWVFRRLAREMAVEL